MNRVQMLKRLREMKKEHKIEIDRISKELSIKDREITTKSDR